MSTTSVAAQKVATTYSLYGTVIAVVPPGKSHSLVWRAIWNAVRA